MEFSGLYSDSLDRIFGQSILNFRECFRKVQAEFLGLFLDSPDRIFGIVFNQSGTDFRTVCVLVFLCVIEKN